MRLVWLLVGGCFVTEAELERALDRDEDGFLPVQTGGDDCNEGRADINPDAVEICGDGIDNDCDGVPDDDGIGASTWFRDADDDGFGVEDETTTACTEPEGYAPLAGDCDDTDGSINPNAADLCDGIDQDCDGVPDDEVALTLKYPDGDGDGFGVEEGAFFACDDLEGYVLQGGDCDDADPTVNPAAADACDGIDQNCNGLVDEDVVFTLRFRDDDGDGYGLDDDTLESCGVTPGYSLVGGDCDDTDSGVSPGAVDLCDGVDQDCDSVVDDDAVLTLYFEDADGDGVGTGASFVEDCAVPAGYSQLDGDCDDTDPGIQPGVTDICDGVDQDCDGAVDEDAAFEVWFEDGDADGLGGVSQASTCDGAPQGFVASSGDCDDTDPLVTIPLWYADGDGDGYGTGGTASACVEPSGFTALAGDCDDTRANVNPGRNEVCNNGRDDDCDPVTDCRLVGTFFSDEADIGVLVPSDGRVFYVGDVVGDAAGDWAMESSGVVTVHEGPVPDFGSGLATPCTLLPTPIGDVLGGSHEELACSAGPLTQVVLEGGTLQQVVSLTTTGPDLRSIVALPDSPMGPGLWASSGTSARFFSGLSGALTDADELHAVTCGGTRSSTSISVGESSAGPVLIMNCDDPSASYVVESAGFATTDVAAASWSRVSADVVVSIGVPSGPLAGGLFLVELQTGGIASGLAEFYPAGFVVPPGSPAVALQSLPNQLAVFVPLGDLDLDGELDWMVIDNTLLFPRADIIYGGPASLFSTDATLHIAPDSGSALDLDQVAFGDVDADGYADIIFKENVGTDDFVRVFFGRGP